MKTCCGCLSTRSGTLSILLLYIVLYIAGIIALGINLSDKQVSDWYSKQDAINDCKAGTNKDSWWCKSMDDFQYDIKAFCIAVVILLSLYLLFAIVAVFGTSRGNHWPLLPWIIMEFMRLVLMLTLFVMTIIIWAVYMEETADSSILIATGVIGAACLAFFFYLWLCVVSYFQLLREIAQLGLDHKVSPSHHAVTPFVMDSDMDKEEPFDDTVSEHTAKESLEDEVTPVSDVKPSTLESQ